MEAALAPPAQWQVFAGQPAAIALQAPPPQQLEQYQGGAQEGYVAEEGAYAADEAMGGDDSDSEGDGAGAMGGEGGAGAGASGQPPLNYKSKPRRKATQKPIVSAAASRSLRALPRRGEPVWEPRPPAGNRSRRKQASVRTHRSSEGPRNQRRSSRGRIALATRCGASPLLLGAWVSSRQSAVPKGPQRWRPLCASGNRFPEAALRCPQRQTQCQQPWQGALDDEQRTSRRACAAVAHATPPLPC